MRSLSRVRVLLGSLIALVVAAAAPAPADGASAYPPMEQPAGPQTLQFAGLRVRLPAQKGVRYDVFAYWHTHPGEQADGHDEIVEHFGDSYRTTWVKVAPFPGDACGKVVGGIAADSAWQRDGVTLWGASWVVRGGGTLADRVGFPESPFVALCTPGERQGLVLIQFFDDGAPPADEDAAIAALGRSKVLAAVWDAYARRRTVDASPALVTPGRGDEYGWPLRLGGVGLVVPVPEDGYVWAPAGTARGEDDIVRLAPAMPELLVKVVRAPAEVPCAELFVAVSVPRAPGAARHVPKGWKAGPVLRYPTGVRGVTACHSGPRGTFLAAITTIPESLDVKPAAQLLDALARAIDEPPGT